MLANLRTSLTLLLLSSTVVGCSTSNFTAAAQGTQGLTGPAGPAGPPGLIFLDTYNPTTQYVPTDVVTFLGSSYVAKSNTLNVPPAGASTSAASWSILAQAGATGATGAAGPQGVSGPQGPAGPQGPTSSGALNGLHFGVQGDSISANFGNAWQNVVAARTGMSMVSLDARAGRRFDLAFECYGTTTPGDTLGVFKIANNPSTCFSSAGTDGQTLAQNLAGVDIEIIALGTNDQGVPLGALGDATSARTFYGNMRWVVENYLAAKPAMRVVLVTLQYNGFALHPVNQQYAAATEAYGRSVGVPVVNMFTLGGVNDLTVGTLTSDGTHPNTAGFTKFYGPVIAQALQQLF